MRSLLTLALGAALVAPPSPSPPPDGKGVGRLEGKVLDADERPLAEATVTLGHAAADRRTTAKTDRKGRWSVPGLAAGDWTVVVTAPGYAAHSARVHLASETKHLPPLLVRLAKAPLKGPSPEFVLTLGKAEQAYREGRYGDAIAQYEKLLALRPELSTTIHRQLGLARHEQRDFARALEHLQKVLDADPQDIPVRTFMVQTALAGGLVDRGLALLRAIDESAIKRPELFYNIGAALLNANRPEEAIAYFTKALAVDPGYVEGYFRRGLAYLQLQRVEECKADLRRVLEIAREGPLAETAQTTLEQLR